MYGRCPDGTRNIVSERISGGPAKTASHFAWPNNPVYPRHFGETAAAGFVGITRTFPHRLKWGVGLVTPKDVLAIVFGGVLLYMMVRVFQSPTRWFIRVVIQGALGLVALWGWDRLFLSHGWAVGLNPVTGAAVGVLGPAGFLLLVAVKVLLF